MKQIMKFVVPVVGFLLLLTSIPLTVHASLIDQFNFPTGTPSFDGAPLLGRYNVGAQTFTVGITGTLTSVDLPIYTKTGDTIDWQIRSTNNGILDPFLNSSTILASGTIVFPPGQPTFSLPGPSFNFYSIDLSSYNVYVTENDQLAILIGGFAPWEDYDRWIGSPIDQYSGGKAYENVSIFGPPIIDSNGNFISYGPLMGEFPWSTVTLAPGLDMSDFYFATHVEPIPEPSTMLLLGSGLAGLVGYGRRRLKK